MATNSAIVLATSDSKSPFDTENKAEIAKLQEVRARVFVEAPLLSSCVYVWKIHYPAALCVWKIHYSAAHVCIYIYVCVCVCGEVPLLSSPVCSWKSHKPGLLNQRC
jgi:hypothetical protein